MLTFVAFTICTRNPRWQFYGRYLHLAKCKKYIHWLMMVALLLHFAAWRLIAS